MESWVIKITMFSKLENISMIVLDVDGTLTDGGIYYDNQGYETKKFNVKDGLGILLGRQMGIEFLILTGRNSKCVELRAEELKVQYVKQGISNKVEYLKEFISENKLSTDKIAYMGDDLNDLTAMKFVGVSACPANAVFEIREHCDFILNSKGGEGAVREFVEMVLKSKGKWVDAVTNFSI